MHSLNQISTTGDHQKFKAGPVNRTILAVGCSDKVNCAHVGPGPVGGPSKGSYLVFTQVSEKTTENAERLGRQARPGIEPESSFL